MFNNNVLYNDVVHVFRAHDATPRRAERASPAGKYNIIIYTYTYLLYIYIYIYIIYFSFSTPRVARSAADVNSGALSICRFGCLCRRMRWQNFRFFWNENRVLEVRCHNGGSVSSQRVVWTTFKSPWYDMRDSCASANMLKQLIRYIIEPLPIQLCSMAYMYICIYTCMYTYVRMHTYVCIYIYMYVYMHMYMYLYMSLRGRARPRGRWGRD